MGRLELSPLMSEDEAEARSLVAALAGGTRYAARITEQLDAALRFEDPEHLAILARDGRHLAGLALFGTVAGARSCTKLHALLASGEETLALLADGIVRVCVESGERLAVYEIADEPALASAASAAERAGFLEEGRVPHFVADGVALRLLVWRRR